MTYIFKCSSKQSKTYHATVPLTQTQDFSQVCFPVFLLIRILIRIRIRIRIRINKLEVWLRGSTKMLWIQYAGLFLMIYNYLGESLRSTGHQDYHDQVLAVR